MQIHGSTHSKCMKPRTDKKIAKSLGLESPDLRDMVGNLELNATRPTDYAILRELHWVFMGGEYGGGGVVQITNAKGQVFTYTSLTKKQLAAKEKREAKKKAQAA